MSRRYFYVDDDGDFGSKLLSKERDKILPRFLALPPKPNIFLGMTISTDVYITIREIKIEGMGAGVVAYVVMPQVFNVQQQPIPIQSQAYSCTTPEGVYMDHMLPCINMKGEPIEETVWVYPRAKVLYRRLMNTIYKVYAEHHFVQMGLGYRPTRIMVDDPALATVIRDDLHGSGTNVEVILEGTAMYRQIEYAQKADPETGELVTDVDTIVSDKMMPVAGAAGFVILQHFQDELTPEEREHLYPNAVQDSLVESLKHPGEVRMPKESTVTNSIVKSCLFCGSLLQARVLKLCVKCVNCEREKQAFYCDAECQKTHWPTHKLQHKKAPVAADTK